MYETKAYCILAKFFSHVKPNKNIYEKTYMQLKQN